MPLNSGNDCCGPVEASADAYVEYSVMLLRQICPMYVMEAKIKRRSKNPLHHEAAQYCTHTAAHAREKGAAFRCVLPQKITLRG